MAAVAQSVAKFGELVEPITERSFAAEAWLKQRPSRLIGDRILEFAKVEELELAR